MKPLNYTVTPGTSVSDGVERAIAIARAVNKAIIVVMNGARFGVKPDTTAKAAIDAYLDVKNMMFQTEKMLREHENQH